MLHYAGDEVYEIYKTLNLGHSHENYNETKKGLTDYFKPQKNTEFLRYEFSNQKQDQDTIDSYVTRLRQTANDCEFADKDSQIKTQFIKGLKSEKLRRKCMEEKKLYRT